MTDCYLQAWRTCTCILPKVFCFGSAVCTMQCVNAFFLFSFFYFLVNHAMKPRWSRVVLSIKLHTEVLYLHEHWMRCYIYSSCCSFHFYWSLPGIIYYNHFLQNSGKMVLFNPCFNFKKKKDFLVASRHLNQTILSNRSSITHLLDVMYMYTTKLPVHSCTSDYVLSFL